MAFPVNGGSNICCLGNLGSKHTAHTSVHSGTVLVSPHVSPRDAFSASSSRPCTATRRDISVCSSASNSPRDVRANYLSEATQRTALAIRPPLQQENEPLPEQRPLGSVAAPAAQTITGPTQLYTLKARDGNRVTARVAYALSDVAFIYPITPATPMAEAIDEFAAEGRRNLNGNIVQVMEMEGEGGVAGALHGALLAGALATTFTCSQGLLLMIPNMYKIAGALLPCVMHVTARTIASDAMSMFCDHQDVMGVRQTGWAMLCSNDAQEAQDLALVAHLATFKASLPFVHFFDGIITSHEIKKVSMLDQEAYRPLLDGIQQQIRAHRARALNPAHPSHRGAAQSHEVLMQAWESTNPFYQATPDLVEETMNEVGVITGRKHELFEYYGAPDAERVVVSMGSSCCVLQEAVDYLTARGEKVGLLKVHLFRPWSAKHLLAALPVTATRLAVLDRTKEGGSMGEPLYLDVVASVAQDIAAGGSVRRVVGGRYGLGGKAFTPEMAIAVYDNLQQQKPKDRFTVGITDDVTHTSLPIGPEVDTLPSGTYQCIFWGMGSDGTVGANKEAIKIIGAADKDIYVQGSFGFDAHKSGSVTISQLRFGRQPINGSYPIRQADYVGIHLASYLEKYDCLSKLKPGGVLVINTLWQDAKDMEQALPAQVLRQLAELRPQVYLVNARAVANSVGLGKRINMVMQTVFFQLSGVLPLEQAIPLLKEAITNTYSKQGASVIACNHAAVDAAMSAVVKIEIPQDWATAGADTVSSPVDEVLLSAAQSPAARAAAANLGLQTFVDGVMQPMLEMQADQLPVSAFKAGNCLPPGTTSVEKRTVASKVPHWDPSQCTECNSCSFICPHAAIRPVVATAAELAEGSVPQGFEVKTLKGAKAASAGQEYLYRVQVSPRDCTGCSLCVTACAPGSLTMRPIAEELTQQQDNWEFARTLLNKGSLFNPATVRGSQFQQPLLEFSGACEGCGETAYVKLLTQMFGERMVIANACGCSSVWGGWAPNNPYTVTPEGRGPAWATSLLEDNAQFGMGIHFALKQRRSSYAAAVQDLLMRSEQGGSEQLRAAFEEWLQVMNNGLLCHQAVMKLQPLLEVEAGSAGAPPVLQQLLEGVDLLEKPSVWIVGGDGWAYDIGFAGLDHVVASKEDVNILVLDTEGYSNTGGQRSKSTPLGAVVSLSAAGKETSKKDLAMMMMDAYGQDVYVASVCLEADHKQVVKAFAEAEAHKGVSIIVAYAPCAMHGISKGMSCSAQQARAAVDVGYWPLWRWNPPTDGHHLIHVDGQGTSVAVKKGKLSLDSKKQKGQLEDYLQGQVRFSALSRKNPEVSADLHQQMEGDILARLDKLRRIAGADFHD